MIHQRPSLSAHRASLSGAWAEAVKNLTAVAKENAGTINKAASAGIARRATDQGRVRRNLKKIARLRKRASRLKARIRKLETQGRRFLGIPLGSGKRKIARLKRRVKKIEGNIKALQAEASGLEVKASTAATRAQAGVKGAEAREAEAQSRVAVEASRTEAEGSKQRTILIGSVAAVAGMVLIAVILKGQRSTRDTIQFRPAPSGGHVRGAR